MYICSCAHSASFLSSPIDACSVEAHDFDPVRAFTRRIFVLELQRAARLVDRINGDRLRLFSARNEEPALGIDRKAARLTLGRRAAEISKLAARTIDAETRQRVTR